MNNFNFDHHTLMGTAGGTLLVIIMQINAEQVLTSAILAATGALVSFVVSLFCKWVLKQITLRNSKLKT